MGLDALSALRSAQRVTGYRRTRTVKFVGLAGHGSHLHAGGGAPRLYDDDGAH